MPPGEKSGMPPPPSGPPAPGPKSGPPPVSYIATSGATWNYIAATAIVAMLPPMLIFLVLGRYIVRGLTFGAVKG